MNFLNPDYKKLDLKQPYVWLATWFGCGFVNKAPGTCGSLGALPFGILIAFYAGSPGLLMASLLALVVGLWAARKFDTVTGGHDSRMIVIDEAAGLWITMIPAGLDPLLLFFSFLLFRFFDIVKPWPVSFFDKKVKGAAGVMGDDLVAGLYAALCVMGLVYAGLG